MAVTIKKIAELAGVSRGTVDRALNNRGGVSLEAERRIKKIAAQLNYHPNVIAKALASSNKVITMGLIINSGNSPFFDDVFRGIERAQHDIQGFKSNIITTKLTGYSVTDQLDAIENMMKNSISGLIITPINDATIAKKLNEIIADGTPVVALNADITSVFGKLAYVGCDYFKSGQIAAELLAQISSNEARVAIITGSSKMLGHTNRIEGFKNVVRTYENIHITGVYEGSDDYELTYLATKEAIECGNLTALYFVAGGTDGGIKAVCEHNLQRKIKIITVDSTKSTKNFLAENIVNLTVCQQPFRQGYDSVQFLFSKIMYGKNPPRQYMYTQNEVKTKYQID